MAWAANQLLQDEYFDFQDIEVEEPIEWRGPASLEVKHHLLQKELERVIKGFSQAKTRMKNKCKQLEQELKQEKLMNSHLDKQNTERQTTKKNNIKQTNINKTRK